MTTPQPEPKKSKMPEGIVYTPYPPAAQRGGGLLEALELVANALPAAVLGAAVLARRSTKRNKRRT